MVMIIEVDFTRTFAKDKFIVLKNVKINTHPLYDDVFTEDYERNQCKMNFEYLEETIIDQMNSRRCFWKNDKINTSRYTGRRSKIITIEYITVMEFIQTIGSTQRNNLKC